LGTSSQLLDLALRIRELLGVSGDLSIFLLNDVFEFMKVSRDGAEECIGKGVGWFCVLWLDQSRTLTVNWEVVLQGEAYCLDRQLKLLFQARKRISDKKSSDNEL
jgi:hypothetical protein